MASAPETRPLPTKPFGTFVYKEFKGSRLQIDVHIPDSSNTRPFFVALFIPGGGWMRVNRDDYSHVLCNELHRLNYVFCSINYGLLPETSVTELLEHLNAAATWIRQNLCQEMEKKSVKVDCSKLLVLGQSAGGWGGLVAAVSMIPPPDAIIALSTPTNMHELPFLGHRQHIPPCTSDLLKSATDYENPPSTFPIPRSKEEYEQPRIHVWNHIVESGIMKEFIVHGLRKEGDGRSITLSLPEKGSASIEETNAISPFHLCEKYNYPPIGLIMGKEDDLFDYNSHLIEFEKKLQSRGVKCKTMVVEGEGHAFDIWAESDGYVHMKVLRPMMEWASQF